MTTSERSVRPPAEATPSRRDKLDGNLVLPTPQTPRRYQSNPQKTEKQSTPGHLWTRPIPRGIVRRTRGTPLPSNSTLQYSSSAKHQIRIRFAHNQIPKPQPQEKTKSRTKTPCRMNTFRGRYCLRAMSNTRPEQLVCSRLATPRPWRATTHPGPPPIGTAQTPRNDFGS